MKDFRTFYKERNGLEYMSIEDSGSTPITIFFHRLCNTMADYMDYLAKQKD